MQKILIALLFVVQAGMVMGQSYSGTPPYLTKSLSNESIQQIDAQTTGGNISVFGGDAGKARIEVYIRGNNDNGDLSTDEIRKRLEEQYDLDVSAANHKLTAIAKGKPRFNNWRKGLSISFKIYVPQDCSTDLRTSGGNISLKNLSGTQDFKTSGGNLDIDVLTGKINGRTSGGNINISDSKTDIDLATSGGNIGAIHCEGQMKLTTSGGNLSLRLLKGNIRATTSGGSVTGEAIDGDLDTRTSGGNIHLKDIACGLTAGTSAGNLDVSFRQLGSHVDLHNSGGNITLQLPANKGLDLKIYADRIKTSTLSNFKGDIDEHHIEGAVNGGGIPVKIDGSSGRVELIFK